MKLGINGRFYGAGITGVQRFAREVSARLLQGAECTLFLPRSVARPAGLPAGIRVAHGRLSGHAWEQLELPLQAQRAECDTVLHLSGTAPFWGPAHVMIVHDVFPFTHPHWFTRRFSAWYRVAAARSARGAAAVLTVSNWSQQELMRVLGLRASHVHVVTQGLAPYDRPATREAIDRVRDRLRLPESYLLASGAGDPRKNIAFLTGMLDRWRERDGSAPLLVVAGERNPRVHSHVSMPPTGAEIRYVGRVDDDTMLALYSGAAAFCFPSLAEGFGRPPLEALACGTPAVVAPYGAAHEILDDAALIVALDYDAWIRALSRLLEQPLERAALVERGRQTASRYKWDDAASQVLDVCRAAAPRRGVTLSPAVR
jgi:glycosyltransferase involved in cell wall biosynthesis